MLWENKSLYLRLNKLNALFMYFLMPNSFVNNWLDMLTSESQNRTSWSLSWVRVRGRGYSNNFRSLTHTHTHTDSHYRYTTASEHPSFLYIYISYISYQFSIEVYVKLVLYILLAGRICTWQFSKSSPPHPTPSTHTLWFSFQSKKGIAGNFSWTKISPTKPCYLQLFAWINFYQCSNGRYIFYVIILTGQIFHKIKISTMRAGGRIGENFLLAKFSS